MWKVSVVLEAQNVKSFILAWPSLTLQKVHTSFSASVRYHVADHSLFVLRVWIACILVAFSSIHMRPHQAFVCANQCGVCYSTKSADSVSPCVGSSFTHWPWLSLQKADQTECQILKRAIPTWTFDWLLGEKWPIYDEMEKCTGVAAADLGTDSRSFLILLMHDHISQQRQCSIKVDELSVRLCNFSYLVWMSQIL